MNQYRELVEYCAMIRYKDYGGRDHVDFVHHDLLSSNDSSQQIIFVEWVNESGGGSSSNLYKY